MNPKSNFFTKRMVGMWKWLRQYNNSKRQLDKYKDKQVLERLWSNAGKWGDL